MTFHSLQSQNEFSPVMSLSGAEVLLHRRALRLSSSHRKIESRLIDVLQKIDRSRLYKKFGVSSLHNYAVKILDLSEPVAYSFITVARKASEVQELKDAIDSQLVSVAKASRIASVLNAENANELIEFARTHSKRDVDFEVAKISPRAANPDRVSPLTEELVEIKVVVTRAGLAKLQRAQSLRAQKSQDSSMGATIEASLDRFLYINDPVVKAQRALQKIDAKNETENSEKLCPDRVPFEETEGRDSKHRVPLSSETKHEVFARDGGRCTYKDKNGVRCENDRHLHVHHILPVSKGGSNATENLTTLCSSHHDLVHQLALPIEGQVSWIRDRARPYSAGRWTIF